MATRDVSVEVPAVATPAAANPDGPAMVAIVFWFGIERLNQQAGETDDQA
jgi:hypothetical protein